MSLLFALAAVQYAAGPLPVLKHSDVVFMYHADRDTYRAYGATVLAWGGKPTPEARTEAEGVRWFGSVGMVTEFARYYERDPATYEEGLCRDVYGKPVKVPWLTDHQHRGIPYWWCCTNQPRMRDYVRDRTVETIRAGADGLHVDDHLGTSGGLWLGICFCERCMVGFREHLAGLPASERERLGVSDPASFDFRAEARRWLEAGKDRNVMQHPLWPEFEVYQTQAAAAFMMELRALAAETAGKPVPVGANAGLLWGRHLADYQALDMFSAETDHHASSRKPSDDPVLAYRIAEAVGRPYASTASGWDWAYIKEHNLPGLVRCWIALSYAAGHMLMAPHRQWCYTSEKGTHWYDGPAEKFAPLYRFVRDNAALFDGCETLADLRLVMPNRAFIRNPGAWMEKARKLSAANLSFTLILAGDRIVQKRVSASEMKGSTPIVMADQADLDPADARTIEAGVRRGRVRTYADVERAIAEVKPVVRVGSDRPVRAFARIKRGSAVVHMINYDYDAARDDVTPIEGLTVTLDLKRLGVGAAKQCKVVRPGHAPLNLPIVNGVVRIPRLDLWAIVAVGRP